MSAPHLNPTLFFQDTFTETSDTTLASHTPDQGTGWTLVWGTNGSSTLQVVGASDNLVPGATQSNSGVIYSADGVYPSADYEVSAVIGSGFIGAHRVYLIVRMTDQENMYALRLTTGASATRMYKKTNGTWVALGSFQTDPSPGDKVTIRVVGSTLSYYYNGVLIDTQTDTAIPDIGKAGIAVGGGAELAASGDDITTSASLDSFTVGLPSFAYTQFASSVTSMPVNLPPTQPGDLLIAAAHVRNSGSWTPPSGWTEFGSQIGGGSVGELTLFYKIANGGEGGQATWTASTGTTAVWQVFRIKNWHGSSVPEIQTTSGDATAADPPSISPSWGAAESLILTIAGHSAASTAAWSAGPSGYSTQRQHGASSGGAAVCISSAYKEITASSEDPGAFTVSGSNRWWAALTIAIRPATYGQVETADVDPVSATFSVVSTTATYDQVETASVEPVSSTFSVPDVTATYQSVQTASVASVTSLLSVVATTATFISLWTAGVAPVTANLSTVGPTATYEQINTATVEPITANFSVVDTTAEYSEGANASVEPVSMAISLPSVTATYQGIFNADVDPISATLSIPGITATYEEINSAVVEPVTATFSLTDTTASFGSTGTVEVLPVVMTLGVVDTTANYTQTETAGVVPVVITLELNDVTAVQVLIATAEVAPVTINCSLTDTTAIASFIYSADVSPLVLHFSVTSITPTISSLETGQIYVSVVNNRMQFSIVNNLLNANIVPVGSELEISNNEINTSVENISTRVSVRKL